MLGPRSADIECTFCDVIGLILEFSSGGKMPAILSYHKLVPPACLMSKARNLAQQTFDSNLLLCNYLPNFIHPSTSSNEWKPKTRHTNFRLSNFSASIQIELSRLSAQCRLKWWLMQLYFAHPELPKILIFGSLSNVNKGLE